jgi:two-component system, cell cycle response regulator DivK
VRSRIACLTPLQGVMAFTNLDQTRTVTTSQYAPDSVNTSQRSVLVVEDHDDTRLMLRTMLELRGGIAVVEAANGAMAVALATNVHIDLILMDTDLPVLDGYAATSRIRECTPNHEIPIVMMSGYAEPAAQIRAFAAGCTEYLIKPFSLRGIDSVVNRYLYADKTKLARTL